MRGFDMIYKIILLVLFVILLPSAGVGDEPGGGGYADYARVEKAILHIVQKGIPRHKIKAFPRSPINKRPGLRKKFVTGIVEASVKYDIPPMVLVSIAYRENGFYLKPQGKIGERGAFQIAPKTYRHIRKGAFPWSDVKEKGCRTQTYEGGALCAAALLRVNQDRCETLWGAVVLYASGRTCKPDNRHLRWLVRDRMGLANRLDRMFPRDKK